MADALRRDGGEDTSEDRSEAPTQAAGSRRPAEASSLEKSTASARSSDGPPERLAAEADHSVDTSVDTSLTGATRSLARTPLQTLHAEEIQRTRVFIWVSMGMALFVGFTGFFVGDEPIARTAMIAGMCVVFSACATFAFVLREDSGYSVRRALLNGYCSVTGSLGAVYFFGVFSPASIVFPFGLYFFGLAQDLRATLSIYLLSAVGYGGLVVAIMTGLVVDRGMVTGAELDVYEELMVLALVEMVFFATFVTARKSRQASLRAVSDHDKTVRNLAQREALLREAREELERALQAGGVGRYTDEQLGSYRLGSIIGRGGMGEVYEAVHVETSQQAAVKLLQPRLLSDPDAIRRFIREAKVVRTLDVPNVARVFEVGGLDAPVPYIAMERLRGMDLSEYLRDRRRLSLQKAVAMVRDVGVGLEAARRVDIVHRDLKPRNLFRAEADNGSITWKILDFGVSKLITGQHTLTQDQVVGTPAYMAPEQAYGDEVTHRTDLYALGVISYRVLTGRPAFAGDRLPDTLYAVTHSMPPSPTSVVSSLPAQIDLVLAIAMAKTPAERFDSAQSFLAALEAASRGELDVGLAQRAASLLERQPWGSRPSSAARS